jgi:hypothetical protein
MLRVQASAAAAAAASQLQSELIAQHEFEPVPSNAMTFAKLVAGHADVELDKLITIVPIEEPEDRKQQRPEEPWVPKSMFRHCTPLLVYALKRAVADCAKVGVTEQQIPDKLDKFAHLTAQYVIEKQLKKAFNTMSATEARRFCNEQLMRQALRDAGRKLDF